MIYGNKIISLLEISNIKKYGKENLNNAIIKNIDKFGKDQNYNILYITGISGSGKSTVALYFKDKDTYILHLDSYFKLGKDKRYEKNKNKEFNMFLNKNNFDHYKLNNKELFDSNIKEYFKLVDRFAYLSEKFGKESYKNGKKVIIEGVQLNDDTLYPDKNFFNNKPFIKLLTDDNTSLKRAKNRDKNI